MTSLRFNRSKISEFLLIVHLLHSYVSACSLRPPCGVIPDELTLTNVTGIVHVGITQYENECGSVDYQDPSWQIVDKKRIEIDVDTGVIRTEEETWLAEPTKENLGLDMPTVDQSGYELRLTEGSEQVTVTGTKFGADITFTLPNLDAPAQQNMYDGVVSFYSESMDRLYFIYPTVDSSYSIASCVLDANSPTCVVSASDMDFFDIDKVSSQVKVYDSMQLVALPVVCCLCIDSYYFVFDEATLLKKVDILSLTLNPIAVDSRIAMAYAINGGYEEDIFIISESLSIDSITSKNEDMLMTNEELAEVFQGGDGSEPVAAPVTAPVAPPNVNEKETMSPVVSSGVPFKGYSNSISTFLLLIPTYLMLHNY
jgi:hypothetical protein